MHLDSTLISVTFKYVCEACHVSIRKAIKCKDKGELYQLSSLAGQTPPPKGGKGSGQLRIMSS